MKMPDFYEFLQISPNAEQATVHRVYRFLAGRFHPDNPVTGDAEKFVLLKQAFDVLSNPESRAEYDAAYKKEAPQPVPLSTSIDFLDSIDGELNRRLALLGLLYIKRRTNPYVPELSLAEIESRMGCPRDYLQFTTWYLVSKKYVTQTDSADYTLTALGVDFVEENRASVPVLNKLLTTGSEADTDAELANKALNPSRTPIITPSTGGALEAGGSKGGNSE